MTKLDNVKKRYGIEPPKITRVANGIVIRSGPAINMTAKEFVKDLDRQEAEEFAEMGMDLAKMKAAGYGPDSDPDDFLGDKRFALDP